MTSLLFILLGALIGVPIGYKVATFLLFVDNLEILEDD